MSGDCDERGCRNLETRCKDCGRLVNSAQLADGWISVGGRLPEKNEVAYFLYCINGMPTCNGSTKDGITAGYFFYNAVDGWHMYIDMRKVYPNGQVTHWMLLPKPPCEPLSRRHENGQEGYQDDNQNDNQVDR